MLARAKSNISVDEGGVSYTIESATIETEHGPIETTRVLWGDKLEGSARDILGDVETTGEDGDRSELDEACDFLRELLADDPIPTKQVKAEASDAGYAWKTIRNARDAIGAKSFRKGEKGRKGGGNWYWSLRCPSDFGHLNNLDDGHLNQIQENQWFQPYSDDENELRCPSLGVGTLIENPVIGPDEEGI
ncbi:Uncharacterised protein [Pseudomonas aeruginosa]|nr:Uncharacterised protein [Pseudomonas aeruginosa]